MFFRSHLFIPSKASNKPLWILILALVNCTCCAHYAKNTVLIKKITDYFSVSKSTSTSAGNSPHPDLGCSVFEFLCTTTLLLSVEAAVTHPPRFFLISLTLFLAARSKQRQLAVLEPFDMPLGRMCWTTTYSDAFFLLSPQEVQKRNVVGE